MRRAPSRATGSPTASVSRSQAAVAARSWGSWRTSARTIRRCSRCGPAAVACGACPRRRSSPSSRRSSCSSSTRRRRLHARPEAGPGLRLRWSGRVLGRVLVVGLRASRRRSLVELRAAGPAGVDARLSRRRADEPPRRYRGGAVGTVSAVAVVRPFRALRYDPAVAGGLESLVAPPYDVIEPEQREELLGQSPYNVVHLTLPDSEDEAAASLAEWREQGVLVRDPEPACWWLSQEYVGPDGVARRREGFVAALRLEPYDRTRRPPARAHARGAEGGPAAAAARHADAARAALLPLGRDDRGRRPRRARPAERRGQLSGGSMRSSRRRSWTSSPTRSS